MESSGLTFDELHYELMIRGEQRRDLTLRQARQRLSALANNPIVPLVLNSEGELQTCQSKLASLTSAVEEYQGTGSDTDFETLDNRMGHLLRRVQRITEKNLSKEVKTTLDAIHALDEALEMKCRENTRNAITRLPTVVPPKHDIQPNTCPVYKWNFNFNGEGSVIEFLERLEELRRSRNATKLDLFNAASDLFTGSALLWYRANKGSLTDWDQLVQQLKKYYHPIDYDHRLWQEILQRKQAPLEHPSDFITSMQILFSRLTEPVTEEKQLFTIKYNLDSYYSQHVAALDILSIDGLHQVCQRLELAKSSSRGTSSTASSSLPTVCRRESRSSTSTFPSFPRQKSLSPSPRHVSFAVDSACWNCKQPGHLYSACTMPRKQFCYRCGTTGFTVRNCPKCHRPSGNGARES